MAEVVTVRGEGGAVFEVDLELNPAVRRQIEAGQITVVQDAAAAGADDAPAAAAPAAAPKPRKPRTTRKK